MSSGSLPEISVNSHNGVNMLSKSFLKEVETIHKDTNSGAAKIAEKCLTALKRECLRFENLRDKQILKTAIKLLLDTHPMATIESALFPVYSRLTRLTTPSNFEDEDPKAVIELIFATRLEQMRIGEKNTINTLVNTIKDKKSLLTFSHSSTVITALLQLAGEGYMDKEIYVLESRPLKEGERTAYSLANAGFKKTHLGIDFAVNEFSEKAEIAVLGADMIHNGLVLNKIGSATIAKLFQMQSKEVIVAASPSKICLQALIDPDQDMDHPWLPTIPHRNVKEITKISSPNLVIWNKYFEIIKPEWISSLIMDCNQFFPPISNGLSEFLEKSTILFEVKQIKETWHDVDFTMV